MAETCIVCLGDLALQEEASTAATDTASTGDSLADGADPQTDRHPSRAPKLASPAPTPAAEDEDLVAHLLPCGHNMHNECLKPWVERANSCPICRANFNMVELCVRVGGPTISSYSVQDRQQVAEVDPSMIVDDDLLLEDDGSYDACMVCDEFGDSSTLMYCASCEQLCHVFCAGLDDMPARAWYCQGCMDNPELRAVATQYSRPRGPAAFINGRSRLRRRRTGAPDEWVGVWQSVWDRLHFDVEFPFEDDDQEEERSEVQRREQEEWGRRFALARALGAGNRFRAAADNVHVRPSAGTRPRPVNRTLHVETPPAPRNPESQEELRAWNQFEKAKEHMAGLEEEPSPSNSRRRKRTATPEAEAPADNQEPERKFKRPRARAVLDNGGPSATKRTNDTEQSTPQGSAVSPPADLKDSSDGTGPGFLQSILHEVAVDRFAEEEKEVLAPQPRRVIVERAMSPQHSSPGLSPIYSQAATPPPLNIARPTSPQSVDEGHKSPTYAPYSPADGDTRQRRHTLRDQGPSSPPRSKDSSPSRSSSLSYSTKSELHRMVTAVLKPYYIRKEISKDGYTQINRDVSRLLYERVGDAGAQALVDHVSRERWHKMAADEVEIAVKARQTNAGAALTPAGDDSASISF